MRVLRRRQALTRQNPSPSLPPLLLALPLYDLLSHSSTSSPFFSFLFYFSFLLSLSLSFSFFHFLFDPFPNVSAGVERTRCERRSGRRRRGAQRKKAALLLTQALNLFFQSLCRRRCSSETLTCLINLCLQQYTHTHTHSREKERQMEIEWIESKEKGKNSRQDKATQKMPKMPKMPRKGETEKQRNTFKISKQQQDVLAQRRRAQACPG